MDVQAPQSIMREKTHGASEVWKFCDINFTSIPSHHLGDRVKWVTTLTGGQGHIKDCFREGNFNDNILHLEKEEFHFLVNPLRVDLNIYREWG